MASKKTAFPQLIQPQLVSLVGKPPAGDWLYENKFDGYRLLVRLDKKVTLFTRNGFDWTQRMPRLASDLARLPVRGVWLDGEVVVLDEDGKPAFQPLQAAFNTGQTEQLIFYAFDMPFFDGTDLRKRAVEQRRDLLRVLLAQCELQCVRFSETLDADPASLLDSACRLGLEGLIGKRRGSRYSGERGPDWIKLKCQNRQEFIVLGYTQATAGIKSILIGLHDDNGQLIYAGRVRSGLSGRYLKQLQDRLAPLQSSEAPLAAPPSLRAEHVVWVKPQLVVEIKFLEITPSGKVRHAVYVAIRDDKPAAGISLESGSDVM